jgi:sialate O-acetylesterase
MKSSLLRFQLLMLGALAAAFFAAFPQPGQAQPAPTPPIRVACVGDSITAGSGSTFGQSYPAKLGEMLGAGWDVKNFGVSGRTLLRQGDNPYWKEVAFANAKKFNPNIVIILLGTNDVKEQNWKFSDQFVQDYFDLIEEFRALPGQPRIFIGRPCPAPGAGNFGITPEGIAKVLPIIDRIATEKNLPVIDFHAALLGKDSMFPDRVHPNNAGYEVMAATAYRALTGKDLTPRTLPDPYFRSHAVLQRDVPIPVFGSGPDGAKVTVTFAGQTLSTTIENSRWEVTLAPMPASSTPATLSIVGTTTTVAEDVVVGDVWLASGQSNMERQLGPRRPQQEIVGWKEAAARADFPLIRQYSVPQMSGGEECKETYGTWTVCTPQTASDFTAVGFFFARAVQPAAGVPIGIIHASKGGSRIESWMSQEAWKSAPEPETRAGQTFRKSNHFYAMIAPLARIPIRGVLWYQGESNSNFASQYRGLFTSLISSWRELWRQPELPFLFVQIAPFEKMTPEIREAQFQVLRNTRNTAMVVTTDLGDAKDIHPTRKQEVGERLALAAKALAYGGNDEYSGPQFRSATPQGNTLVLAFDHVGQGLAVQGGGELRGFTLAGPDGVFLPATARIVGNEVVVSNDSIPNPIAVRYGWANVPDVNLANTAGLPASPFRSDAPQN